MKDRRRAKRKQDVNHVVIKLIHKGRVTDGLLIRLSLTENMSVCGVKIVTDTFIPKGSLCDIELSLVWSFSAIRITGKVIWVENLTNKFYEMGVEIVDASEDNIRILTEHLTKTGR